MSDLELLYVLLAAFYLWECACWIPRGGVVFAGWRGKHCRVASVIGNQRGGFALAQPLPPLGRIAVATQLPVSLSPAGALAYVATSVTPAGRPPQTGRFVRWDEIKSVAARGKNVRVNDDVFVRAQSTTHARWLAGELRRLGRLGPETRSDAIGKLIESAFNVESVKARWAEFETPARPVRCLANALFLFVFLATPAVIWRFGLEHTWLPLVIGLFAMGGTIAFLFRRAHRSLHPSADDERFTQFLMALLFPPAAIRACDLLSRPLIETFHPLAVASALCNDKELRRFARPLLLDLRNPALPLATEDNLELAAVEEWSRARTLAAAEAALRRSGVDPAELTRPPSPADATCRAFCPRCHAQFTLLDTRCGDCGGLPVRAFAQ